MAGKLTGKNGKGKTVKAKAKPNAKLKKVVKKAVKAPKKAPAEVKPEAPEVDMNGDVLDEEDFFGDDDQEHSIYTNVEGDSDDE